jgi:hypothetical protein
MGAHVAECGGMTPGKRAAGGMREAAERQLDRSGRGRRTLSLSELDPSVAVRTLEALLAGLSLLAVACWLALYRWFSLADHVNTPQFSLFRMSSSFDSAPLRQMTLLFMALSLIYVGGYRLISAAPAMSAAMKLVTIVLVGGPGVLNVYLYPIGAPDLFHYVADLKVLYYYHRNPYLVTLLAFPGDPLGRFDSLRQLPNHYGPAWLLLGSVPVALAGFDDLLRLLATYKAFSLLCVAAVALVIHRSHTDARRAWLGAYVFAANPLLLFEAVGNGHNDVVMSALLLAGVVALRRRSWWAAPLVTLAALTKLFALLALPLCAMAMARGRWGRERVAQAALLSAAVTFAAAAPFWAGGGMLRGTARSLDVAWQMTVFTIPSLLGEYLRLHQAAPATIIALRFAFAGLFALAGLVLLWRVRDWERAMIYILLLFFALASSLGIWYFIPVIALLALRHDRRSVAALALASGLGLVAYPLSVWAQLYTGWPLFRSHAVLTLFVAQPIIGLLALAGWLAGRAGTGGGAAPAKVDGGARAASDSWRVDG